MNKKYSKLLEENILLQNNPAVPYTPPPVCVEFWRF